MTAITTREEWLQEATAHLSAELFDPNGYTVPAVKVSVGFPLGSKGGKVIGQCWAKEASADNTAQIFIHPILDEASRVLDVLAHELIHATLGAGEGHGKAFKQCALGIGLGGQMTATVATDELKDYLGELVERIGEYPHARLDASKSGVKKQGTRLIKCECGNCGYNVRTTKKWLEVGTPICPACHLNMVAEGMEEEPEEE